MVSQTENSRKQIGVWQGSDSLLWQVFGCVSCWLYMAALHWRNDGLWYPGDSAVHSMNGVFWMDYLSRFTFRPAEFALSYYVRYPFINPVNYPPVFYLLEAGAYRVFGASPLVAKTLVLLFTLMGTLYLLAWLRRWVSQAAGWAALLFPLQPAILTWSHAVMLNIPAATMDLAALYHWRRWLESRRPAQLYLAVGWALAGILTYSSSAVVLLIMGCWILYAKQLKALLSVRVACSAAVSALLIGAWTVLAGSRDSGHRNVAFYLGDYPSWKLSSWLYYPDRLSTMVRFSTLLLVCAAIVLPFFIRGMRKEAGYSVIWLISCYLWFSVFSVKEPRYILLIVAPLEILAAQGVVGAIELLHIEVLARRTLYASAVFLGLAAFNVARARTVIVPEVSGVKAIVAYIRDLAPNQWVFYDGSYEGAFTYYYRLSDPDFTGGVVRGGKLLYETRIEPKFGLVQNVSNASDVIAKFRTEVPCRYLLVERGIPFDIQAEAALRDALTTPQFHFLRSFAVKMPKTSFVDLYEYTGVHPEAKDFEYGFPVLGDDVHLKATPIHR